MKEGITKEELLDVAQWLEDAAHSVQTIKQMLYMQRAEFVRGKVVEME